MPPLAMRHSVPPRYQNLGITITTVHLLEVLKTMKNTHPIQLLYADGATSLAASSVFILEWVRINELGAEKKTKIRIKTN